MKSVTISKSMVAASPDRTAYNEDYFERGAIMGISGYMSYGWMPENTLRMAHCLIQQLPIGQHERVLDFGCAKGFLVKALRILDIDAFGIDISEYATSQVPAEVRNYCFLGDGQQNDVWEKGPFHWLFSKDVFEHIGEADLVRLMTTARHHVQRMFTVIPVGKDNSSGRFVVPDYDHDCTHVTAKTVEWWTDLFQRTGWQVVDVRYSFRGVKENWTRVWPRGNAFFTLG